MDALSNIIRVLLKKISYEPFLLGNADCLNLDKDTLLQFVHGYMSPYSDTEIKNRMESLELFLSSYNEFLHVENMGSHMSVFDAMFRFVEQILIRANNEVLVKYDYLLRWRATTSDISEEILIAAFLARDDFFKNMFNRDFTWPFVISHNNIQLRRLTAQGMAENHFHLWGSSPYFHISWIWMMNHVSEVEQTNVFSKFIKNPRTLYFSSSAQKIESDLKKSCLLAAVIRIYLFGLLHENICLNKENEQKTKEQKMQERLKFFLRHYEEMRWHIDEVQEIIDGLWSEEDYAIGKGNKVSYQEIKENYILSGERKFLYEMFLRIVARDKRLTNYDYNLFYVYLIIKEHIRGEMVQTNEWVGFENFSIYQSRTGSFGKSFRLENMKVRMAVQSCFQQNVTKLELRISPFETAEQNYREIRNLDFAIDEKKELRNKYYYVFHFIKKKDISYIETEWCEYRHLMFRHEIYKKTIAILKMREIYPEEARRVLGIDAAAQEIGCRPEVFAQAYRTLREHTCFVYTVKGYVKLPQLRMTYHVGEDFLDLVDGLRAIDEAIVFLNLECGDRLGHCLALGILPIKWYQGKKFRISLSKQDYLDNVVWLYHALVRYQISGMDNLKAWLLKEYDRLFEEVYAGFISEDYVKEIQKQNGNHMIRAKVDFGIQEYFDAWKLRGDSPELYRRGYYLDDSQLASLYERNAVNQKFPENFDLRKHCAVSILYYYYHFNSNVRLEGSRPIEKKIDEEYVKGVTAVQKAMQYEILHRGIGIETNPSSNLMIGTFDRYEEHPIVSFYNNGLTVNSEELNESPQLWVSINTDDQGIFNIKLENEYALLARALEKKKDSDGNLLYKKTMIYEWLDKIRKMGLEQSFLQENIRRDDI